MKHTPHNLSIQGALPGPVASEFFFDRSYVSGINGCLGSGKTTTTIFKLLTIAGEQEPNSLGIRPSRLICLRNVYPDLIATTIRDWNDLTGSLAPVRFSHPPAQLLQWSLPDGTSVELDVIFLAADREEDVRKLRGLQASFVWLNEAREIRKAILDMAFRALGRYPSMALGGVKCTKEQMLMDFNAPDNDEWISNYIDNPPEDWRFFIQPPGVIEVQPNLFVTNPESENLLNLPDKYYEKLVQGKKKDWILVNLCNQRGSHFNGKQIFSEFAEHLHVMEFAVNPKRAIIAGADFGLTPACVFAQLDGTQLCVFDEIVTENFSTEELSECMEQKLAAEYPGMEFSFGWGDPAGASRSQTDKQTCFNILNSNGFPFAPTYTNSFETRRDAVTKRLLSLSRSGSPNLILHPRCVMLRKALSGAYQFKRIRTIGDDRFMDIPDKNIYSHIAEALQYLCLGVGTVKTDSTDSYSNWKYPINVVPINRSPRKGLLGTVYNPNINYKFGN